MHEIIFHVNYKMRVTKASPQRPRWPRRPRFPPHCSSGFISFCSLFALVCAPKSRYWAPKVADLRLHREKEKVSKSYSLHRPLVCKKRPLTQGRITAQLVYSLTRLDSTASLHTRTKIHIFFFGQYNLVKL